MRHKWIEERFPRWFIFGEKLEEGLVDIANPEGNFAFNIPKNEAVKLIERRDGFVDEMIEFFMKHPDAFWPRGLVKVKDKTNDHTQKSNEG